MTRDFVRPSAVEIVAEQRMPQMREMHANLMRAPGLKGQPQETVPAVRRDGLIMRPRGLPGGGDAAQDDARQGARNGRVDDVRRRR